MLRIATYETQGQTRFAVVCCGRRVTATELQDICNYINANRRFYDGLVFRVEK